MATEIDNLKLNKDGVIKEFPDLKDNNNWKIINFGLYLLIFERRLSKDNKL